MKHVGAQAPERTPLLRSRTQVPSATARRVFNVVLRSGHFRVPRSHRVERQILPGHELLYCVSGTGYVLSESRPFRVDPLTPMADAPCKGQDFTFPVGRRVLPCPSASRPPRAPIGHDYPGLSHLLPKRRSRAGASEKQLMKQSTNP